MEHSTLVISMVFYKVASLASGVGLSYMGYRLFMAGVRGQAGDMEAAHNETRIVLSRAAPGTFFAVLGAAVVVFTLLRGLEYEADAGVSVTPGPALHRFTLPEEPPKKIKNEG